MGMSLELCDLPNLLEQALQQAHLQFQWKVQRDKASLLHCNTSNELTDQKERLYVTSESAGVMAERRRRRRLPLADEQDGASSELN